LAGHVQKNAVLASAAHSIRRAKFSRSSAGKYFGKKRNPRPSTKFYFGITKLEEDALNKTLIVGALAFAAVSIAQTANAAEFYVVRDATTKKCTIVDSKPTSTTTTIVDDGTFKTKTEAETGMKTMKVCTTN
jgi:hypothetical protein